MSEKDTADTLLKKLIEKYSTGECCWVSATCFVIVCIAIACIIICIGGICISLCTTQKLNDENIRLIIYGCLMTIVFIFLIPVSEKFFAFKLYEEIGKQEAARQNAAVQICTTALEQILAKDISEIDRAKLLATINAYLDECKKGKNNKAGNSNE